MNTWDKCQNCGADYGLHRYKTNQCPVGGREAPVGRIQEWSDAVFVKDTGDIESKLAALTAERDRLREALQLVVGAYDSPDHKNVFRGYIEIARAAHDKAKG